MADSSGDDKKSLHDRAFERIDVRMELSRLEAMLEDLRIQYEQFFMQVRQHAPDKLHRQVKQLIRKLQKAPFKSSELTYRLRSIENRYRTYHTYWQRVNRQREEGTYVRDVFKANMRERHALEEAHAQTAQGKAQKSMHSLFDSYKQALEKTTGKQHKLDYNAFQKSLVQRAKKYKEKHGNKQLTFKVVVKNGKVSVQAKEKKRKKA